MKIFTALFLHGLIAFAIIQNWMLCSVVAVIWFSYLYGGLFLIPTAIFIDGYFGNFDAVPYLSIFSVFWYLLVEYIRPKVARLGESEL